MSILGWTTTKACMTAAVLCFAYRQQDQYLKKEKKKKGHDIRQIVLAQHGTSAFMQAFVVFQPKVDTRKSVIWWKKLWVIWHIFIPVGYTYTHTQNKASYFLPFRPKTTTLQQSNSHTVTSTVKLKSRFSTPREIGLKHEWHLTGKTINKKHNTFL